MRAGRVTMHLPRRPVMQLSYWVHVIRVMPGLGTSSYPKSQCALAK